MKGFLLQAKVLIDVANLSHAIGRACANGDGPVESRPVLPDLARVRDVFDHFGIEVTGFGVALPLEPVEQLGVRADHASSGRAIARSRRWLSQQRAALGKEMVCAIAGGIDGHHELGVDAMCVLTAIAESWKRDVKAVVVISNDADVMVAQDYVTDTPIFVAGSFTSEQRRQLRTEQRGWIDLRAPALRHMAARVPAATPPLPPVESDPAVDEREGSEEVSVDGRHLVWLEHGRRIKMSSALCAVPDVTRHERRLQAVKGAKTVAVTDPYGISVSVGRAIGIAKLPTPATVEESLAVLGFDLPLAQFAAVPDIIDRMLEHADLDELRRRALKQLDSELETLIDAHREGGDIRTLVSVGRLAAERTDAIDPELRHIEEKKVLTTLAADVLWALRHTELPVAVISDRAELAYLLTKLEQFVPSTPQRLVRIGLHGQPIRIEEDSGRSSGDDASVEDAEPAGLAPPCNALPTSGTGVQVVVLNGPCAAELTGLVRQLHGPALLAAIHREIADESVEWRMVRFDATTLGAILSPVCRPEVEAVFHRMLELDDDVARYLIGGGIVPAGALEVRLQRNLSRPCEIPTLHAGRDDDDVLHDLAMMVEHRDGSLHLDIDGDQRPDIAIAIGHGAEAYLPGHTVVYRRAVTPSQQPELLGPVLPRDHDQRPHVVVANGDGTITDPDSGTTHPLLELPDLSDLERPPGSRLLAYPCGDASYQALSTSLAHL